MIAVTGLAARRGDTAFAFIALRFAAPATRAQVTRVLDHLAPLVAEADAALDEIDAPVRLVAVPWVPADSAAALVLQRRLLDGAAALGVEAAWCFQAGTSLPPVGATPRQDDDVAWSNGPPPQVREARFPVDGVADAIAVHDGGDLGLALKLAGPPVPGEDSVLLAFHALWLAPYGGRYRDASVTFDRAHRAAYLWAARFAPPCWPEQLVHHLIWIGTRIDEVVPVAHGRVAPAALVRHVDEAELQVLAGNPLVAMYDAGGEAAVDAWLAAQREWSPEEQAHMLRELALELATEPAEEEPLEAAARLDDEDDGDDDDDDDLDEGDDDNDDVDPGDPGEHADDDDDDDEDDDEPEGNEDEDRGRQVTRQAGELLRLRAAGSRLDPRAAEALIPVLGERGANEARRGAVVDVLGALGDPAAVPALTHVARAGGDGALADRAARALLAIADDTSVN